MDNDDSESESSRHSKDGSDWPVSQDSHEGQLLFVVFRPMDNDDSESESSRRSKNGSDWPVSQDSASLSVDDDMTMERLDDDRQTQQQHRHEVNEAKRAKLREIEVSELLYSLTHLLSHYIIFHEI